MFRGGCGMCQWDMPMFDIFWLLIVVSDKRTKMVDKFDGLKITPWKHHNEQWTLSVFAGPYNTNITSVIRIVIVDDSKVYAMRLKYMLMRIVLVQDHQKLEIQTFHDLTTAKKYLHQFKCTLVFVDNVFPCSSTGLLMVHGLMQTAHCPTKLVMMSGHAVSEDVPRITKIHKKLLNTKTVRAFIIQAGISHHPGVRKLRKLARNPCRDLTRDLTRDPLLWVRGKDPRPLRVRQLAQLQ